jgi:hypothetical protein
MNYRELQQITYDCGLSKNYLFENILIERNKSYYNLKEICEKILNHTSTRKTFKGDSRQRLQNLAEKLQPKSTTIKNEIKEEITEEKEINNLISISDMSKKFGFDISVIYRIFKDYPNFTITKCQRRPTGMKMFNFHQVKDALEIAIHKNLVPSKIEEIKKIYEKLPDFSNLGIYPLANRQIREVSEKMNIVFKKEPEIKESNIDSLIKLTEKTNTLLEKLISIWEK